MKRGAAEGMDKGRDTQREGYMKKGMARGWTEKEKGIDRKREGWTKKVRVRGM